MVESKQIFAPKSGAAVRLSLLAGHNADLAEAANSFHLASHMVASGVAHERNLVRPLVANATVSYGRCFTISYTKGWRKLHDVISIPEEWLAAHDSLMRLRNSTVAHSESSLTPSFPIVNLDREGSEIRATAASAMTVHPSFSSEAIDTYHGLVTAVKRILLLEIEQAKGALLAELVESDLEELWDRGALPKVELIPFDEWDIQSRRPEYPEDTRVPVLVNPSRTFLVASSGDSSRNPERKSVS